MFTPYEFAVRYQEARKIWIKQVPSRQRSEGDEKRTVHPGVLCNKCKALPIEGRCHRCLICTVPGHICPHC